MKLRRLGVNIDHVATVRNARGESYPSPLRAAILAQKYGPLFSADNVVKKLYNNSSFKRLPLSLAIFTVAIVFFS